MPLTLPDLPEAWLTVEPIKVRRAKVAGERSAALDKGVSVSRETALAWLNAHSGEPCRAVRLVMRAEVARLESGAEARHDAMVEAVMALVRLGSEGHLGVRAGLRPVKEAFLGAFTEAETKGARGADLDGEWERAVVGAVSAVSGAAVVEPHGAAKADCPVHRPELWPSFNAPLEVAARFVAEGWTVGGVVTLRRWRGQFYRWAGPHYEPLSEEVLLAELGALLRDKECYGAGSSGAGPTLLRWNPTPAKLGMVMRMLPAVPGVLIADSVEAADGLDGAISLRNGLLDVGDRTLAAHSPERFALTSLPFDFDPDAACKAWLAFLDSLWPGAQDAADFLAQWFGYVLSGRTDFQKIALFVGPRRSGKGTIGRVLADLAGREFVIGPTLSRIGGTFGLQQFLGKTLAVIGDAESSARAAAGALDDLKSISGEDQITVQRKNRDEWSGRLPTRIVLLANNVPAFLDTSGALAERLLPLPFHESFAGREDVELGDRLAGELAGVFVWALDGLDVLIDAGRFEVPRVSREMKRALFEEFSPVTAFLNECCETEAAPDTAEWTERREIYGAYQEWCSEHGRRPTTLEAFGRDLRSVLPRVMGRGNPLRMSDGSRARVYYGVWLLDEDRDTR